MRGCFDGRRTLVPALCLALLVPVSTAAFAAPPAVPGTDPNTYVLFATQELQFKGGGGTLASGGMIVGGNIGVNNPGGTLMYSTSAVAHMSPGTWAVADNASSGPNSNGSLHWLYANSVNQGWVGGSGATVVDPNPATLSPIGVGQYAWNASGGLFASMPTLPFVPSYQRMASANDVLVNGTTVNLSPGDYRDVEFRSSAVVNLGDGVYNMRSLKIGSSNPGVVVNVTDKTVLQIDQYFDAGDRMRFGANPESNGGACVYVGSIKNSANDFYNTTTERTTNWGHFGRGSGGSLHMQYYAPNGWLDLGGDMELYGRYWAYRITGDPGNNLYLEMVVPEPSSLAALLAGLGSFGGMLIRRKR